MYNYKIKPDLHTSDKMETRHSFPKLKRYTLMAVFTAAILCHGACTEAKVEEYQFEKYYLVIQLVKHMSKIPTNLLHDSPRLCRVPPTRGDIRRTGG